MNGAKSTVQRCMYSTEDFLYVKIQTWKWKIKQNSVVSLISVPNLKFAHENWLQQNTLSGSLQFLSKDWDLEIISRKTKQKIGENPFPRLWVDNVWKRLVQVPSRRPCFGVYRQERHFAHRLSAFRLSVSKKSARNHELMGKPVHTIWEVEPKRNWVWVKLKMD